MAPCSPHDLRPVPAQWVSQMCRSVRAEGVVGIVEGYWAPAVKTGDVIMRIDPRYFRPAAVDTLLGDPARAKAKMGWVPEITVQQMCAEMVAEALALARRHALLKDHGCIVPMGLEG